MSQPANYLANTTCERLQDIADPDVTGLGVVTSFIISITFNFSAIIMAYFFRWLPESRYSEIDDAFVHEIWSFFQSSISPSRILPEWERREQARHREFMKRKRIRAFESFMVAMSDQQLITGVALIITTTFMSFDPHLSASFSVYSFQVATRLGYFSCIVHLCTVSLLREHFDTGKRLRDFRVLLVAIILVLLVICMVISDSVTFRFNRHISVQCAKSNFRFVDPERPGYVGFSDEVIVIFNLVVLVLVILTGYSRRFLEIYYKSARTDYHYWPRKSLRVFFGRDGEVAYSRASPGVNSLLEILQNSSRRRRGRTSCFGYWVLLLDIWVESISTSLLWDIIWLSFYLTFGMGNFWSFYMDAGLKLSMKPNFGQVVPLILVCLPFLSAWEAFTGKLCRYQLATLSFIEEVVRDDHDFEPRVISGLLSSNQDEDSDPLLAAHTSGNTEGILTVAKRLKIPLLWFKSCTFIYWVGLMVWALMFAGVIPGHGAFYVSIISCVIFAGFVMANTAAWFKAVYYVMIHRLSWGRFYNGCCEAVTALMSYVLDKLRR
ncbi:hypothetical protein LX32DRAFT_709274 [Colletotrichum zoysiae]|uniref:Uncharacterized protein n=1 Tax=Colletotrichum zoysiae TaxID=1216348 RepID=A0AAD9H6U8_9PEZI|nr:hypothetical protein LX32DRAFT_709274 [Colletotrichum zoysiae]